MTNPILKIENVSFVYGKNTPFQKDALHDVSFHVKKGEFLGLIGHTGSGKSTLNQLLNGLLYPEQGRITFDNGEDKIILLPKVETKRRRKKKLNADEIKLRDLRFKVGLVFQYPEHQLFEETVYKDIAFGPRNMGVAEDEIDGRVKEALALVGLDEALLEESPFALSGGQQRRAAIAGVLAMRPEVLILDEPTAGLDPAGRDEILQNIRDHHKQTGATVILVTHSMEDIARHVERIVVLRRGEILTQGTPRDVFRQSDLLRSNGLAPPQVTQIMAKLALLVPGMDTGIHTVEQAAAYLERAKTDA